MSKKTLYLDMDGVLADFGAAIDHHPLMNIAPYDKEPDLIPNIFKDLRPIKGSKAAVHQLLESNRFEIYILTTAPWNNPNAWTHKRLWIEKHYGEIFKKRVIISHSKNLLKGDFLIDDRTANGAGAFEGEHIHFGWNYELACHNPFPNWDTVIQYLLETS